MCQVSLKIDIFSLFVSLEQIRLKLKIETQTINHEINRSFFSLLFFGLKIIEFDPNLHEFKINVLDHILMKFDKDWTIF